MNPEKPLFSGHKHQVRALRRGVEANQALLPPTSSTQSALSGHSSKGTLSKSANKIVETQNETVSQLGTALVRHQSSGCLSRHCQSTLSLCRATALNKVRSRSMNLIMVQPDAASTSSSSDDGYVDERRGSVSLNLVNGRPRSLSVRTTSMTKEDEQGSFKGRE